MGKVKIDIEKAIEMRVKGTTLRDIGRELGVTAEAVRQAFQRAEKKKKEQKKLARLLVSASISDQGKTKSPADINKTIDEWAMILEAAKKGIALESEVADLKQRIDQLERLISSATKHATRRKTTTER